MDIEKLKNMIDKAFEESAKLTCEYEATCMVEEKDESSRS